jgi:hypothetical protein
MIDHNANSYRNPSNCVPGEQQTRNAPAEDANKKPWDDEPTWPEGEYDDETVADGMCDDDVDPPSPWMSAALGFQQPSLWDEAIARILACKSRSDSP